MDYDKEHLRLLSIFHYICAGVTAAFACFPIIHLAMGIFMVVSPQFFKEANNSVVMPAFVGWFFIIFASAFILLGWAFAVCLFLAGRFLKQSKHYYYCFVIAVLSCLCFPFGTVLGIFTIIVLSKPTVRELFLGQPAGAGAEAGQPKN